jgi:hypothetical protein
VSSKGKTTASEVVYGGSNPSSAAYRSEDIFILTYSHIICVMKTCKICTQTKPLNEFYKKRSNGKNSYMHICKVCSNAKSKVNYQKNREWYIKRDAKRDKVWRNWLSSLKEGKPCQNCKQVYHPVVMDWHHRDPSLKIRGVAHFRPTNKQAVYEEIAKCDLLCSNCHRYLTHVKDYSSEKSVTSC